MGIDAVSRYHPNIFLVRRNKITKTLFGRGCSKLDLPEQEDGIVY
jgi:hypothetical protein